MSEDLVHCRSCQAKMELPTHYETRYGDGELHLIGEYRCNQCRSILILDLGEIDQSSEEYLEVVEDEIIIG
jgi:hypothetical protein